MGTQSTLLCIHRDPGKLLHLEENGYQLVTATNGSEGLRLLMSRRVDVSIMGCWTVRFSTDELGSLSECRETV